MSQLPSSGWSEGMAHASMKWTNSSVQKSLSISTAPFGKAFELRWRAIPSRDSNHFMDSPELCLIRLESEIRVLERQWPLGTIWEKSAICSRLSRATTGTTVYLRCDCEIGLKIDAKNWEQSAVVNCQDRRPSPV